MGKKKKVPKEKRVVGRRVVVTRVVEKRKEKRVERKKEKRRERLKLRKLLFYQNQRLGRKVQILSRSFLVKHPRNNQIIQNYFVHIVANQNHYLQLMNLQKEYKKLKWRREKQELPLVFHPLKNLAQLRRRPQRASRVATILRMVRIFFFFFFSLLFFSFHNN